jgi:tetratricopeptide (TPR) repeat protein
MKNLYQILGLDRTATAADIQRAYKEYAAQYQPDRHANSPFFTERFKEVLAAYETLNDPVKRGEYDAETRTTAEWKQKFHKAEAARHEMEAAWAAARDRGEVAGGPPRSGKGGAAFLGFVLGAVLALAGGWGFLHFKGSTFSASLTNSTTSNGAAGAIDSAAVAKRAALVQRINKLLDKEAFAAAIQVTDSAMARKPGTRPDSLPNPDQGQLYFLRAIAKHELKNDSGALRDYTSSIAAGGRDAAVFNNRGLLRQSTGDLLGAEQDFWLAVALAPNEPLYRLNLGALQIDQKNFVQAETQLATAAAAAPANAEAWLLLGNARYELKRQSGACAAWHKADSLGLEPATENVRQFCQ